jgi:hypothetical protein
MNRSKNRPKSSDSLIESIDYLGCTGRHFSTFCNCVPSCTLAVPDRGECRSKTCTHFDIIAIRFFASFPLLTLNQSIVTKYQEYRNKSLAVSDQSSFRHTVALQPHQLWLPGRGSASVAPCFPALLINVSRTPTHSLYCCCLNFRAYV